MRALLMGGLGTKTSCAEIAVIVLGYALPAEIPLA
jgi:hypothetical protein